MDQGVAALIAGLVGMAGAIVGALVGGKWAVRGARIGGEKAVEAARLQVLGQASAGQLQWVRDRRHQAYANLIDAQVAVMDMLRQAAPGVRRGGSLSDDVLGELPSRILALESCTSQLAFWGPEQTTHLAQRLTAKTIDAAQALRDAEPGAQSPVGQEERWANWEQERQVATNLRARFLGQAGTIMRDPGQPVS